MRSVFSLLLLFSTTGVLYAQEGDKQGEQLLILEDGSDIRGVILEKSKDSIRFEMNGGKTLVLRREEVRAIEKVSGGEDKGGGQGGKKEGSQEKKGAPNPKKGEEAKEDPNPIFPREGYQHHLSPAFFGVLSPSAWRVEFDLYSYHTFRFSPDLAVGTYAGAQFRDEVGGAGQFSLSFLNSFGILLNGYLLHDSPVAPFWRFQSGYSREFEEPGLEGFFLDPGFGVTFFYGGGEGKGISLRSDYTFFYLEERFDPSMIETHRYHGVSLGVVFHL